MNKQANYGFMIGIALLCSPCLSQETTSETDPNVAAPLFQDEAPLPIKISYATKELKKITNDSTYMDAEFHYQDKDGTWQPMQAQVRKRGNYRLKKCYYTPIKIKMKKGTTEGTLFKGSRKLKLVMPCLQERDNNDNVLKEMLAYKLYEKVSPYHFKTRMVKIELEDQRGSKVKTHQIIGFLIEDFDKIAARHNANVLKRKVHPMQQDAMGSIRNDFFQFMIGNTDFSNAYQHNERLLFVDSKTVPVPYDFDMSGLVNASYAVVSQIGDKELAITDVKQRLYRGFKRDVGIYQECRQDYLKAKPELLAVVDNHKEYFSSEYEYTQAREYLMGFFTVMADDKRFDKEILAAARTK